MIRIDRGAIVKPSLTFNRGKNKGKDKFEFYKNELISFYDLHHAKIAKGEKKFNFRSKIYSHPVVKDLLITSQNGKCCFCESYITHISYGDVEHFRPKAAYKQDDTDQLIFPGYYWLAYEFDNLFLSCQLCNQRNKMNLFPLIDEAKRVTNHRGNITEEETLFINPTLDDPRLHISFNNEVAVPLNFSAIGNVSINNLGLNRLKLIEVRMSRLKPLLSLVQIINLYPQLPDFEVERLDAINILRDLINELIDQGSEFSSMFASFYESELENIIL